jgi:hypothetical protein
VPTITFTSARGCPVRQSVESIRPTVWYFSGGPPSPMKTVVTFVPPTFFEDPVVLGGGVHIQIGQPIGRADVSALPRPQVGGESGHAVRISAPTVKSQLPVAGRVARGRWDRRAVDASTSPTPAIAVANRITEGPSRFYRAELQGEPTPRLFVVGDFDRIGFRAGLAGQDESFVEVLPLEDVIDLHVHLAVA